MMPEQGYKEQSARARLDILRQQSLQSAIEDSVASRLAKRSRKKDFAQQIQPIFEEVHFEKGQTVGHSVPGVVGQMGRSRQGKIVQARGKMAGNPNIGPGSGRTYRTDTGGMTSLEKKQRWTTEGYQGMGTQTKGPMRKKFETTVHSTRKGQSLTEKMLESVVNKKPMIQLQFPGAV